VQVRRPAVLLVVVLLVSGLTGCGSGQKKASTTRAREARSAARTAAVTPPKPIATVEDTAVGVNKPVPFRVLIYDLRRDGPFLVLDFGVKCLTPSSGCLLADVFAPGYQTLSELRTDPWTAAGVRLVDPTGLKEYLPVRDPQGRPYASFFSQGVAGLTDSLVHLEWVRYPVPPTSVTTLDVAFPDAGPIVANVPITSGPGPTAGGQIQPAQPAPFSQPPESTNATGLSMPVESLIATSGNALGSDSESPGQAQLTLQSDVLFQFDKSNLMPKALAILRSVAQQIKARARGPVQVTGYTDSVGSDAVNVPLSQARARSVVKALTPLTPGVSYSSQGLGSADPVAPNTNPDGSDNPAGRALNRRVTVAFAAAPIRPTPPAPIASAASPAAQSASMTFSRSFTGASDTYRVNDAGLSRNGNLLVLAMTLTCAASQPGNTCVPTIELAGVPTVPPQPVYANGPGGLSGPLTRSISAFALLDPSTGTESIPVRRTDTLPLTSSIADPIPVNDGYRVWIYFAAPPAATTSLTLISPGGAARLGPIPISDSPPATP
jgi:outer membrane protein OmpA-like peptidoglycan-associated protein